MSTYNYINNNLIIFSGLLNNDCIKYALKNKFKITIDCYGICYDD